MSAKLPPLFLPPLTPCNVPVQRCPVSRDTASHRILLMRTGAHGDILMGTTVLAALRHAYPNAHLTWIAEHSAVQAIDANPYIDEVMRWDGGYWKRMLRRNFVGWVYHALKFQAVLRQRQYDTFISFQPEEWPLLLRGIQPQTSIGIFDTFSRYYGAKQTSPNTRLYTRAYSNPHLPDHRIDQYLLTLEALNLPPAHSKKMTMGYTSEDNTAVSELLASEGIGPSEPYLVLAPMTTWPTKCWPGERFAQLGDTLARRHGVKIVLVASAAPQERAAIADIAAQMQEPAGVLAGTTTFRQMAALLHRAQLVVCGDTGPMHVAAAVGTPYVAIFGATSENWYGPLEGKGVHLAHPVPCGPCDKKFCPNAGEAFEQCLRLIPVARVLKAADSLLGAAVPVG